MTADAPDPERTVRPLRAEDAGTVDAVLALNEHWVPHVGAVSRDRMVSLVEQADLALVVERPTGAGVALDGFVVVMAPGAAYDSPNYRWFEERLASGTAPGPFRYVDRIAVSPDAQGAGVGRLLYDAALERSAEVGAAELTCEVNLEPPNPDSLAFHARMGFVEVGRQWNYGGTVQVQFLARPV
ncbi:GNAT family N-acetyltransferase [Dermatobacter hominis]|uniref:GNAT family N-acetyltransferase n=1 Tax=Dermatobacter hominis TaxID=2884263 RepID=UPI001D0F678D|nr:GNAT family N-acetyltransferase [Dermatobacter hominis]UDY37813.1 GNAT family N-acetyltransferase [Dermatobacter hominis]